MDERPKTRFLVLIGCYWGDVLESSPVLMFLNQFGHSVDFLKLNNLNED